METFEKYTRIVCLTIKPKFREAESGFGMTSIPSEMLYRESCPTPLPQKRFPPFLYIESTQTHKFPQVSTYLKVECLENDKEALEAAKFRLRKSKIDHNLEDNFKSHIKNENICRIF